MPEIKTILDCSQQSDKNVVIKRQVDCALMNVSSLSHDVAGWCMSNMI